MRSGGGTPANKELLKAFGVGVDVKPSVGSVEKALGLIIAAASRHEAAARSAGVLPDDVATARTLLSAVSGADAAQEGKKLTAKQATAAANAVHARLSDNLMHLESIAQVSLPRAQATAFSALTPRVAVKKKAVTTAPS